MKSPDDRLRLRNHLFKLSQGRLIPPSDTAFWLVFVSEHLLATDIFDLASPAELRTLTEQNKVNFIIFIRVLAESLAGDVNVSTTSFRRFSKIRTLNRIRWLTRLVPFLYDMEDYDDIIEKELFWSETFNPLAVIGRSEPLKNPTNIIPERNDSSPTKPNTESNDVPPLALRLVVSLVELLFKDGFTVTGIGLWEPGIGSVPPISKYSRPNPTLDAHRTEILRLLLTLTSPMNKLPLTVVESGNQFLTLVVCFLPRGILLKLVCLLTNLVCRSSREDNALVFPNAPFTEVRHLMVTYAIQLLAAATAYPVPSVDIIRYVSPKKPVNLVRGFLKLLSKENEILFLASGLMRHLRLLLSTHKPGLWATELIVLVWELIQCNKHFRTAFVTKFMSEFVVILLFTVWNFHNHLAHRNLVRVSSYLMLYISLDETLVAPTLEPIDPTFYDLLPGWFKTSPLPVTTRDFVVTHLCWLCTSARMDSLLGTWVDILYNSIVVIKSDIWEIDTPEKKLANSNPGGGLSYALCHTIHTHLLTKWCSRAFLLEKQEHSDYLGLLVRALCTAMVKYPRPSRMLLYLVLKYEKVYERLAQVVASLDDEFFDGTVVKKCGEVVAALEDPDDTDDDNSIASLSRVNTISSLASLNLDVPPFPPKDGEHEDDFDGLEALFRPERLTGMSENAREKLPMESSINRSWTGQDSLRIIMTIVIPYLKKTVRTLTLESTYDVVRTIEESDFEQLIGTNTINYDFLPDTPLCLLVLHWSVESLGYYLSFLYAEVYRGNQNVKTFTSNSRMMSNITTSIAQVSKFTLSWTSFIKGTDQKKEQEQQQVLDAHLEAANDVLTAINQWAGPRVRLFKPELASTGFFGNKFAQLENLVRRFSRLSSRSSVSSTPVEEKEMRFPSRNSIVSLHSLNTLNRSRSNTPRNSISEVEGRS